MDNLFSEPTLEISHKLSDLLINILDAEENLLHGITKNESYYLEGLRLLSRRGFVEDKLSESYAKLYNYSSPKNPSHEFRKRIRKLNGEWEMGLQIEY